MRINVSTDINEFAFSKTSHLKHFKELFEKELKLLYIPFDQNTTLKEYQDFLALFFIKKILSKKSNVLGIGSESMDVLNLIKSEHDCFVLENPEILCMDTYNTSGKTYLKRLGKSSEIIGLDFEAFDFVFSNSVFDYMKFNNPKYEYSNVVINLNRLTKPGGLINVNFRFTETDGIVTPNNLFYKFYKEIFSTHFPEIDYINPVNLKKENRILKFVKSGFEPDKVNTNVHKRFLSYSVLIRKHFPAINISSKMKPGDYLSKRPAYFFHHLIKCGGSSLGVILKQWFHFHNDLYHTVENDFDYFQNLNVFQKYKFNIEYLSSDYCIRGHYQHEGIFLHQRYPEIYKMKDKIRIFTFVRDPFDLLVSLYFFSRNRNLGFENLSLKQYLKGTSNILSRIIPCTESNYKEVLDNYFFIGILEKFQESFDKLASLTGFKKIQVPRYNVSEKDSQLNELSDEFVTEIKKQNNLDYKIYEYCLDKFNSL